MIAHLNLICSRADGISDDEVHLSKISSYVPAHEQIIN